MKGQCRWTEQQVPGRRPAGQHGWIRGGGGMGRWEGLALQAAELGFILRVLGLPEGVRQATVRRGGRDTSGL